MAEKAAEDAARAEQAALEKERIRQEEARYEERYHALHVARNEMRIVLPKAVSNEYGEDEDGDYNSGGGYNAGAYGGYNGSAYGCGEEEVDDGFHSSEED